MTSLPDLWRNKQLDFLRDTAMRLIARIWPISAMRSVAVMLLGGMALNTPRAYPSTPGRKFEKG